MLVRAGAVSFPRDSAVPDVASTVERRLVSGAPLVLLASCRGDDARAALERMKAAFTALPELHEDVAQTIVEAASPCLGAAALVLAERRVLAASSGSARLYRQERHKLSALAAGSHPATLATLLVVTSAELPVGDDFFGTGPGFQLGELMIRDLAQKGFIELLEGTFRSDSLDDLLRRSLERLTPPVKTIAAAALSLGFLNVLEAASAPVKPLRAEVLEAACAVSAASALELVVRCADTASDYTSLPAAIKEMHAVDFLASQVGRDGSNLEQVIRRFGVRPRFLEMSLAGLDRVGATQHRAILLSAVPLLAHFEPGLEEPMRALGLSPVPRATSWTLSNLWGDAPDLAKLAAWHVEHALADFALDASASPSARPVPPRELSSTPSRDELVRQIARRLGRELSQDTPLAELKPEELASIEEAFGLTKPLLRGDGDTVTLLLHRIYDLGRPWALTP